MSDFIFMVLESPWFWAGFLVSVSIWSCVNMVREARSRVAELREQLNESADYAYERLRYKADGMAAEAFNAAMASVFRDVFGIDGNPPFTATDSDFCDGMSPYQGISGMKDKIPDEVASMMRINIVRHMSVESYIAATGGFPRRENAHG